MLWSHPPNLIPHLVPPLQKENIKTAGILLCQQKSIFFSELYHSALQFYLPSAFAAIKKWSIGDSNPWPPHCQCGALPAALMPRANAILPYFSENASTFLKNLQRLCSPVKRVRFMLYSLRVRRPAAGLRRTSIGREYSSAPALAAQRLLP